LSGAVASEVKDEEGCDRTRAGRKRKVGRVRF